MTRTPWAALALLLVGPALSAQLSLSAQTAPAAYLSADDVVAQLQQAAKAAPDMMVARMTTTDAYRVNVVKRTTPQGAIVHDVGTEVHYIIEGAATLVTGGVIVRQAVGTGASPATIRDGETRSVHKGDIMPLTYLEVRFDVKGR